MMTDEGLSGAYAPSAIPCGSEGCRSHARASEPYWQTTLTLEVVPMVCFTCGRCGWHIEQVIDTDTFDREAMQQRALVEAADGLPERLEGVIRAHDFIDTGPDDTSMAHHE